MSPGTDERTMMIKPPSPMIAKPSVTVWLLSLRHPRRRPGSSCPRFAKIGPFFGGGAAARTSARAPPDQIRVTAEPGSVRTYSRGQALE